MQIFILGAGVAGCSAAYALKKVGINPKDITLVEKESFIGGCAHTKFCEGIPYEFGPQILFTDEERLQKFFEEFLTNKSPPTKDGKYHYKLSVDGTLNNPHDFPVTTSNVLKLPNSEKVVYELYNMDLSKPDYSNLEAYLISRVGKTLYEKYFKNYNIKQWKIHPKEMDTEWVSSRALNLREKPDMFGDKWQGHPRNYNPLWRGMVEGCNLIKGEASVEEDYSAAYVNGEKIEADLIISSLPLSKKNLGFINTYKIFVLLKSKDFVMPGAVTTFPNNYSFVRIFEYNQQCFVDSEFTLLDFAFPWTYKTGKHEKDWLSQVGSFCENILNKEIAKSWHIQKEDVYPVPTEKNLKETFRRFDTISNTNIMPIGRMGMFAYISKDTCLRMALILADNLDKILNKGEEKRKVIDMMREKIS